MTRLLDKLANGDTALVREPLPRGRITAIARGLEVRCRCTRCWARSFQKIDGRRRPLCERCGGVIAAEAATGNAVCAGGKQ